jgi:hypothetical protein
VKSGRGARLSGRSIQQPDGILCFGNGADHVSGEFQRRLADVDGMKASYGRDRRYRAGDPAAALFIAVVVGYHAVKLVRTVIVELKKPPQLRQ